ncbi:hypothetical protein GQ53DRAFT_818418 [Thozetella sp. PMI_491]|nr:hypothetical protein GQ53DRAFT_818418 [Thozetella sp. PMI_491]
MDPNIAGGDRPAQDALTFNRINPDLLLRCTIALATIIMFFSTFFVCARAVSKLYIWQGHHVEDWLSYLAFTGLSAYSGIFVYIENYRLELRLSDMDLEQTSRVEYYLDLLYCIYAFTMLAAKLSVLFQLKRIFTTKARDAVYWVVVVSIAANVVIYITLFFCYLLQCWPRERIWNPTVSGSCISGRSVNLAAGILNVVSDLEGLVLPMWAIWHLKVPIRRKLAAYAVFGVGSIATVIGAVGVYLRLVVPLEDFTSMLVMPEVAIVIIVGCAPSLPGIYRRMRGGSGEDSASRPRSNYYYNSRETRSNATVTRNLGGMRGSFAKYLNSNDTVGVTTLAFRQRDEEDVGFQHHAVYSQQDIPELRSPNSVHHPQGIWKTTIFTQAYDKRSMSSSSTDTHPI